MTEVEAAAAVVPNDEEDKDEADEIYSDPNGKLKKKPKIEGKLKVLQFNYWFLILAAVIVSFLDQFGAAVFNDKPPVMTDLMEWISNTDEGRLRISLIFFSFSKKFKFQL